MKLRNSLDRAAPVLFVILWSSGWISARYAANDADPMVFLAIRFSFAAFAFVALGRAAVLTIPAVVRVEALLSGILMHGIYLGGIWWAIANGLPTSLSAVISALQPLAIGIVSPLILRERVTRLQFIGIIVGLAGVFFTVFPSGVRHLGQVAIFPLAANLVSIAAISVAMVHQKIRLTEIPLSALAFWQYLGGAFFALCMALLLGENRIAITLTCIAAMAWSVLGISVGAVSVLSLLIKSSPTTRTASLIFLVPAITAIGAQALFGDHLISEQWLAIATTASGVLLTQYGEKGTDAVTLLKKLRLGLKAI